MPDYSASLLVGKGSLSRPRSDLPPCQFHFCSTQAFVNGAIHWLVLRRDDSGEFSYIVLTFDVHMESFGEMKLQENFTINQPVALRLSVYPDRKSLALFSRYESNTDSHLDIWLMKRYGVEKSWTKLMILIPHGPERCLPEALCFIKSGEVVLARDDYHELILVDMVSKQFRSFGVAGDLLRKAFSYEGVAGDLLRKAFSYEESLVLLDNKNAASY